MEVGRTSETLEQAKRTVPCRNPAWDEQSLFTFIIATTGGYITETLAVLAVSNCVLTELRLEVCKMSCLVVLQL
jgi:hypothetical protein